MAIVAIGDVVSSPDYPWKMRVLKTAMTNHRRGQVALLEAITDMELKKISVFTDRLAIATSYEVTLTAENPGFVFGWTNGWTPRKPPVGWAVSDPEYPKKDK